METFEILKEAHAKVCSTNPSMGMVQLQFEIDKDNNIIKFDAIYQNDAITNYVYLYVNGINIINTNFKYTEYRYLPLLDLNNIKEYVDIAYNNSVISNGKFAIYHLNTIDEIEPKVYVYGTRNNYIEIGLYSKIAYKEIFTKASNDMLLGERFNRFIDFNVLLNMANKCVLEEYCLAKFLEASGKLVSDENNKLNGLTDALSFKAVYAFDTTKGRHTIIATVDSSNMTLQGPAFNLTYIESPWLEDLEMTPYIHMKCSTAIDFAKLPDELGGCHVCLRHTLYPGVIEPHYIFGTSANYTTVGVFSAKVESNVN